MTHPEQQYLDLLKDISENGSHRIDRTKVGTRAVFGRQVRFDLSDGSIPILTTKKVLWQAAAKELLWFLQGHTNIRPLLMEGVTIWTDWPLKKYRQATGEEITQKAFEARIVDDVHFAREWGDLGPVYGKQWRAWRDYDGNEIDQVSVAERLIRNDPYSRRIIIEGWNVAELHLMALTPCHKSYQFFVNEDKHNPEIQRLNLLMSQRSTDTLLGCPFNWVTSALFLRMMAQQCGLEPGEFVWHSADTHIYDNHAEAIATQLSRQPKAPFPKLSFNRKPDSLFDYRFEDFEITGYEHHPAIRAEVAV